ncbi:phosphate/phosphite/phosphonate ABC transporter substrate-binding protein [Geobacter sp. AOG1]|uniref:substrate-binding domain-containing protein n=1 Tax=Geobacter sp. AOG1 TaxID=1566346 RepID=UPI001CC5B3FB|nr:phosphate/phosphite/phosphonate ABC transporter substrate-binding protein [Geobacter sp. AOG1]GFE56917.1 hypothetical protein AOG1_07960 [Geobacter sp. AOG1]
MKMQDAHNPLKMLAAVALTSLLALAMTGCTRSDARKISLEKKAPLSAPVPGPEQPGLRIGMGALNTPKEGYLYYRRLKEYLAKELRMPVTLVDRENNAEMNRLLAVGGVDVAFVGAGPYVEGHDRFGLELLVMPLVKGKSAYHSYIIVPKDSTANSLDDLRGKRFAFTEPQSNSGKLVPTYLLARHKETPKSFFGKVSYTYGHDISIASVAKKLVDGAAVNSLIWDYLARTRPELTTKTRIVYVSEPYGIPPMVVKNLNPALRERLLKVLLSMHETPEGKDVLAGMMIDRFVPGNDANYDSIRAIKRWTMGH